MPPNDHGYDQPSLLDSTDTEGGPTMYDRFVEFLGLNPDFIDTMIRLTRERLYRTGNRRVGVNALIERYRWEVPGDVQDPTFAGRVNNSWGPFIAREIVRRAPDLADVFVTRASRADRHYGVVRVPGGGPRLDRGQAAA